MYFGALTKLTSDLESHGQKGKSHYQHKISDMKLNREVKGEKSGISFPCGWQYEIYALQC